MKRFFSIVIFASLVLFGFKSVVVSAVPSVAAATERENRQLPSFSSIAITGSVDVVVKQGSSQSVVVEADAGLLKRIETEVAGETLTISNPGTFRMVKVMKVYVTVPTLESVKLTGSGDLSTDGTLAVNSFQFRIHGSGDLHLALDSKQVQGVITGSGDAELSGIKGQFDLELTGSGDVKGSDLNLDLLKLQVNGSGDVTLKGVAQKVVVAHFSSGDVHLSGLKASEADVEQRGSGDCSLFVTKTLNLSNAGSGDVYVSGNPQQRRTSSHGSGDVHFN